MISLDALEGKPVELARPEALSVMCRLAALQTRLACQLADTDDGRTADGEDRLLVIDEAASLLGVKPQWLYRHGKALPFVVRLGGKLRYSSRGIEQYIASRRG